MTNKTLAGVKIVLEALEQTPDKTLKWEVIKELLESREFTRSDKNNVKKSLLKNEYVTYNKDSDEIIKINKFDDCKSVSDKHLYELQNKLENYFSEYYSKEMTADEQIININIEKMMADGLNYVNKFYESKKALNEHVSINVEHLYQFGFFDLVEYLEESPKEALNLITNAYTDAYYRFRNEKRNFYIHISNLPEIMNRTSKGRPITLEDINSDTVGKILEFECEILSGSDIKTALKRGTYVCTACGQKKVVDIENAFEISFEPACSKCGQNMLLLEDESDYVDFQELVVQQPLATMRDPEAQAKSKIVFLENPKEGIYAGSYKITGIPIKSQKNKRIQIADIYINALGYSKLENASTIEITEEDEENIKKVVNYLKEKKQDIALFFGQHVFLEIKGIDDIKRALILQQLKGVYKEINNKTYRRESHILIISDPGVAKSTMLKKIAKIPGNTYTSLTGASGVGLIAAVEKVKSLIGDEVWRASLGPLPKSHNGCCCIDEFAVNPSVQKYLLTPMEEGIAVIDKASIHTKLPCATSILAAANPKYGRFREEHTVLEQINMPPQLLSRFDLIYIIQDIPNEEKDAGIMNHIINMHRKAHDKYYGAEISAEIADLDYIEGVKIDQEFINKYILYARNLTPKLGPDVEKILNPHYNSFRALKTHINARHGEAIIRISEALAKSKLKDTVDAQDTKEAIIIVIESLKSVFGDPSDPAKQFDADSALGIDSKEYKLMHEIHEYIKNKYNETKNLVLLEDILENFGKYPEDKIKAKIKALIKNGDIDEPRCNCKYRSV